MIDLERAARIAWIQWGGYAKWTVCAGCDELHYCRSHHGGRFLCLECWDQTPHSRRV